MIEEVARPRHSGGSAGLGKTGAIEMNTRAQKVAGLLGTIHEWVVMNEWQNGFAENTAPISANIEDDGARLVVTAYPAAYGNGELITLVIEDSIRYGERKVRVDVSWPSAGSPRPSLAAFKRFTVATAFIQSVLDEFTPLVDELNAMELSSEIKTELDEADELRTTGGNREIHGEGCELCGEPIGEDEMAEMGEPNSASECLPTYVCHAQCGLDRGMVAA